MHILLLKYFHKKSGDGGVSRFNVLAEKWADTGEKTTIISGTVDRESGRRREDAFFKPFWKEEERQNISSIKAFSTTAMYENPLGKFFSNLTLALSMLIAGIFVKNPDVVIVSSPPPFLGLVGWFISKIKKVPIISEVEGLGTDLDVELKKINNKAVIKFHRWSERFIYKKAKLVITNSPGLKARLIKNKSVPAEKVKMIPNGIDFETIEKYKVESAKGEMGWENNFVITYSGEYSSFYDFESILDLAANISDKKDIMFAFLGDGGQKEKIEKGMQSRWLSNVVLLPAMSYRETSNALKASDICITAVKKDIPLLDLVYANGLFNYIASGHPVVLAGEGVSKYLVCKSADCGVCVGKGDLGELQKTVLDLYENEEKREELGEHGLRFAKEHLDGKKLANEYLETLTPIVEKSKKEKGKKKK